MTDRVSLPATAPDVAEMPLDLQEADHGVVSLSLEGRRLWTYHSIPGSSGHPYFHPVATPAGYALSLEAPFDHVHHMGLWFSWKLIDGVNAWEGPTYDPYDPAIVRTALHTRPAGFSAAYRWQRRDGTPLLDGRMGCRCTRRGPHGYTLDFGYEFTAPGDRPVTLDRNPPPEAGYAGLSVRLIREFRYATYVDADGRDTPPPRGTHTAWHGYAGPIDGGPGRRGGIVLMDNPHNPRFPTPTYTIHEAQEFAFLQCAFLYHEPYLLVPGAPLRLHYRVYVFDGAAVRPEIESCFADFAQAPSALE